jgi:hypothetical protein
LFMIYRFKIKHFCLFLNCRIFRGTYTHPKGPPFRANLTHKTPRIDPKQAKLKPKINYGFHLHFSLPETAIFKNQGDFYPEWT